MVNEWLSSDQSTNKRPLAFHLSLRLLLGSSDAAPLSFRPRRGLRCELLRGLRARILNPDFLLDWCEHVQILRDFFHPPKSLILFSPDFFQCFLSLLGLLASDCFLPNLGFFFFSPGFSDFRKEYLSDCFRKTWGAEATWRFLPAAFVWEQHLDWDFFSSLSSLTTTKTCNRNTSQITTGTVLKDDRSCCYRGYGPLLV